MSKATPATTATDNLIIVNGFIIDQHTGEILEDKRPSLLVGRCDYKSELGKCRSVDDLQHYLEFEDRRKLPLHDIHSLLNEVNYAHGVWRRTGVDCRITLPQQRLLEKMHGLVLYRNVIIMTQAELAASLGTVESNLMKKLRVLIDAGMLRVFTSRDGNIRKGEIKLILNPRLIFRGSDYTKESYIQDWYRPVGTLRLDDQLAIAA